MIKQNPLKVRLMPLAHAEGLEAPCYATPGAAGLDLRAGIPTDEPVNLAVGKRALIPTGFAIALPKGYEAQIRPRSGLAYKHGITCLNTPGTIDSDYRGELKILLINLGEKEFMINRGERIAQLVIAPVTQITWQMVDQFEVTTRDNRGFGTTGTS